MAGSFDLTILLPNRVLLTTCGSDWEPMPSMAALWCAPTILMVSPSSGLAFFTMGSRRRRHLWRSTGAYWRSRPIRCEYRCCKRFRATIWNS